MGLCTSSDILGIGQLAFFERVRLGEGNDSQECNEFYTLDPFLTLVLRNKIV